MRRLRRHLSVIGGILASIAILVGFTAFSFSALTHAGAPSGQPSYYSYAQHTTPSRTIILNDGQNTTEWVCATTNLQDICGDNDGCRVRLIMQHKLDEHDQVRVIDEVIAMENPLETTGRAPGFYGWTRQMGGGDYAWISGNNTHYTVFDPWQWSWMLTYKHQNCVGQNQEVLPAYYFGLMTHPHVKAKYVFYD